MSTNYFTRLNGDTTSVAIKDPIRSCAVIMGILEKKHGYTRVHVPGNLWAWSRQDGTLLTLPTDKTDSLETCIVDNIFYYCSRSWLDLLMLLKCELASINTSASTIEEYNPRITRTMYQTPNTVIFDHVEETAHNKEIVIAEKWGYRVVWCATFFNSGNVHTQLYRVEQLRELDDDDKHFYGSLIAYGIYDVCFAGKRHYAIFYELEPAMLCFAEKVKIAEHKAIALSKVDDLLSTELETINFFKQDDEAYCNDCALHVLFKDCKFYMLQSLRTLSFKDIDGWNYGIDHETSRDYADSDQYEDGLNCSACGCELVEAIETYDEDELVTGFIAGDSVDTMGDYANTQAPADFDSLDYPH